MRTERSRPLVIELETWLREQRAKLSARSETAKAIDYSLKRWTALTRFLDDGRLCMSNNAAERALRGIAVGRHNWTFAGSDEGGRRAAAIYTLIETAKLNDIDPQAWLADVLARLARSSGQAHRRAAALELAPAIAPQPKQPEQLVRGHDRLTRGLHRMRTPKRPGHHRDARCVAVRLVKFCDQPGSNWIEFDNEYNRNGRCRSPCCIHRRWSRGKQNIYLPLYQIGSHCRQTVILTIGKSKGDCNGLAFDESCFA